MSTLVHPFGSIERALITLIARDLPELEGSAERVGTEYPGETNIEDSFVIRIDRVAGSANSFEGDFVVDIEVFSENYLLAEQTSLNIEALVLAHGYHVVICDGRRWVFDDAFQNEGPNDVPWDGDDDTYRFVATYAFTARRSAGSGAAVPGTPPLPAAGGTGYTHHQEVASATWTITHELGYRPGGIRVAADNGDMYFPIIVDLDDDTVVLTMPEPITGFAYLS